MVEVTSEMIKAGWEAWSALDEYEWHGIVTDAIFRAMFDAMPKPQAPEVTEAMLDAAHAAEIAFFRNEVNTCFYESIYRAMRLARPLSEGPGV